MVGRYGQDQLSICLLVMSIILTLLGQFTGISAIVVISYVPLFIALNRSISRDIQKRRMENYKFMMFLSPFFSKVNTIKKRIEGSKTHKYYKCKKCSTMLRVPKGRGKIIVTCPTCKEKFTKKS